MSRPRFLISGGFQPLKAPDAPESVTGNFVQIAVDENNNDFLRINATVAAPFDPGDAAVTSYVVSANVAGGTSIGVASESTTVTIPNISSGTNTLVAQAFNKYGPGDVTPANSTIVAASGNTLFAWGDGLAAGDGALAVYTTTSPLRQPTQTVSNDTDWSFVSAGTFRGQAIRNNGSLYVWGSNNTGSLGINATSPGEASSPIQVGSLTTWSYIQSNDAHCVATKTDGTAWSWGNNDQGQLGVNDTINRSSPVQIGSLTNWKQIHHVDDDGSVGIKFDGTMWAWGGNNYGQLGLNIASTANRSSPVQIGSDSDWDSMIGNAQTVWAIKDNGTLWSWGNNDFGQVGDNTSINRSSPVQVGSLTNWSKLSKGAGYSCLAIKTDGTLWSWGYNFYGQLGLNIQTNVSSPTQVGSDSDWANVYSNSGSVGVSYMQKANNDLYFSGYGNYYGGVWSQASAQRSSPVLIGNFDNIRDMDGGNVTMLAIFDTSNY